MGTDRSKMSFLLLPFMVLALCLAGSCAKPKDKMPVYSRFQNIDSKGWNPLEVLIFEPWPMDSVVVSEDHFSLDLTVRAAMRKTPVSFPIAVTIEDERGVISKDTIVIDFFDDRDDVSPKMKESFGVRQISMNLVPEFKMPDGFAVTLSSLLPESSTEGLIDIGLTMYKLSK